ncbi:P-loop containing nucleoside triphosphate hydrolase protein [Melampsora americana]|nr:P-loop containing nucleoside triphosphate hydrolase protein [Melampsora americana]
MLTRSNSKNLTERPNKQVALTWQRERELVKSAIPPSLRNAPLDYQLEVVAKEFETYGQPGRDLQVKTGVSLVNQCNTFLRAGTGYGKSRIPEVYLSLHPKNPRPVVLTINPLDSLGQNQVADKARRILSAINCTAENATKENFADIKAGVYQFVYMSPEVFLNNALFKRVYFSPDFQRRLILIVVDEAHMIYSWGLVESRKARHSSAHLRTQDRGVFRPSYGELGRSLTSTKAPVLLLSATCCPVAVKAIKKNLKWRDADVVLLEGELVRQEIRLIRIPLQYSPKLGTDVQHFFAPRSVIPDSMIPQTLLYSNTQNQTLATHQAIHHARETLADRFDGKSLCVRRFHAVTGSKDKVQHLEDYSEGKVAIMACTMAVGMGCDWPHTRRVITVGRMDPSTSVQMLGRCGRDGRPGVGIMMVEAKRASGKNQASEFITPFKMTDNDRMDAMAITPVCLCIAFQVNNVIDHVPLSEKDPFYVQEKRRQQDSSMRPCLCSNCRPDLVSMVIAQQPHLTHNNFDHWMTATSIGPTPVTNVWKTPDFEQNKSTTIVSCASNEVIRKNALLNSLAEELSLSFLDLYTKTYPENNCYVRPHHMMTEIHIWKMIKNFELLHNGVSLRKTFGKTTFVSTWMKQKSGQIRGLGGKESGQETKIRFQQCSCRIFRSEKKRQSYPRPSTSVPSAERSGFVVTDQKENTSQYTVDTPHALRTPSRESDSPNVSKYNSPSTLGHQVATGRLIGSQSSHLSPNTYQLPNAFCTPTPVVSSHVFHRPASPVGWSRLNHRNVTPVATSNITYHSDSSNHLYTPLLSSNVEHHQQSSHPVIQPNQAVSRGSYGTIQHGYSSNERCDTTRVVSLPNYLHSSRPNQQGYSPVTVHNNHTRQIHECQKNSLRSSQTPHNRVVSLPTESTIQAGLHLDNPSGIEFRHSSVEPPGEGSLAISQSLPP